MADFGKVVTIRCFDTCTFNVEYPIGFAYMRLLSLKKLFKWLFQFQWYEENAAAIEFLDEEMPKLVDTIKERGQKKIDQAEAVYRGMLADYQVHYKDLDPASLPANWGKTRKKKELTARKRENAAALKVVNEKKRDLERAKKDVQYQIDRAKDVYAIYQNAKI